MVGPEQTGSGWEGGARRRGVGLTAGSGRAVGLVLVVVALAAVVVAVAVLARPSGSGADGAPGADALVVEAGGSPAPAEPAGPPASPPSVREGDWDVIPLDASLGAAVGDGAGGVGQPVLAREVAGRLVVLRGTGVAALDVPGRTWTPLPTYPGSPGTGRAAVSLGDALVVLELAAEQDAAPGWVLDVGAAVEGAGPDGTMAPSEREDEGWIALPPAPVRVRAVGRWAGGLVLIGSSGAGAAGDGAAGDGTAGGPVDGKAVAGQQAWWLERPGAADAAWTRLPDLPAGVQAFQVFDTSAGLVALGARSGPGGAGTSDPVLLRADRTAGAWEPLATPPGAVLGATAVQAVVPEVDGHVDEGGPLGPPVRHGPGDLLVVLAPPVEGVVAAAAYDVAADRWVRADLSTGGAVAPGQVLQGTADGAPAWFRALAVDAPALSLDVGDPDRLAWSAQVPAPDGLVVSTYPVAVGGAVCLVPGRAQPPGREDAEALRCLTPP